MPANTITVAWRQINSKLSTCRGGRRKTGDDHHCYGARAGRRQDPLFRAREKENVTAVFRRLPPPPFSATDHHCLPHQPPPHHGLEGDFVVS
ncbi:hypothetical protein Hanom_Chr02g00099491 [Helianthus anomalus]